MRRLATVLIASGGLLGLLDAYYAGNLPFSPGPDDSQTPAQQQTSELTGVSSGFGKVIQQVNNVLPVPVSAILFFGGLGLAAWAYFKGRR